MAGEQNKLIKVTVWRPREEVGLGAPIAYLGEDHPTSGDWVQSAKAEVSERDEPGRLLRLGRAFLIRSAAYAKEPRYLAYAVENFGAACTKLGYSLPLREEQNTWPMYEPQQLDPAEPEHYQLLFAHIYNVFGKKAAQEQAALLGIPWPSRSGPSTPERSR